MNLFSIGLFLWAAVGVVAVVLAWRESLQRRLEAMTQPPQARCLACGDRFPADEVEWHLLSRHRHERSDR